MNGWADGLCHASSYLGGTAGFSPEFPTAPHRSGSGIIAGRLSPEMAVGITHGSEKVGGL